MSTERLYYNDSHLLEFDARVLSVGPGEGGRARVVLDRTAFYPTGGGQPFDTGALGEARVVDCIDEDEQVVHVVEGALPEAGAEVRGRVDWPRRLEHIQQHTGQHVLSQAFVELYDAQTRSFRMLTDVCEIDVELESPTDEKVWRAVERANEVVWSDRVVRVLNVTPEEAARLPLRKDSAREGTLRVVEIEGFDFSPCGGTHARRTGEIGIICVRSWERAKGMTRVEFVAGARALSEYRRANDAARAVSLALTVGREEIGPSVGRLVEENKRLAKRNRALEELAARVEADELYAKASARSGNGDERKAGEAGAEADGAGDAVRVVAEVFEGRDAEDLRRLALALAARPRTVALLGSREGESARLVFARSADAAGDMGALMRAACETLEGRGGGRPDLAQGGGRHPERLSEVIAAAVRARPAG